MKALKVFTKNTAASKSTEQKNKNIVATLLKSLLYFNTKQRIPLFSQCSLSFDATVFLNI